MVFLEEDIVMVTYNKTHTYDHIISLAPFPSNRLLRILVILFSLVMVLCSAAPGESTHAITADGQTVLLYPDGTWGYKASLQEKRTVILRPDGTWRYQEPPAKASEPIPTYTRPGSSTMFVSGEQVPYGIWLNHTVWQRETTPPQSVVERRFTHTSGQAWAAVIAEPVQLSVEDVKAFVLASAKRHMPDATVVRQEHRMVNGHEVVFLQIDGTSNGVPHTYFTYDYAGEAGTVQVYTWSVSKALEQYERDMLNFLNGFEIYTTSRSR
jgi:hypothetical protein